MKFRPVEPAISERAWRIGASKKIKHEDHEAHEEDSGMESDR
jgi:hypothetical protein